MGGLDLGCLLPAPPLVPICTSRARREGHNNDLTKRATKLCFRPSLICSIPTCAASMRAIRRGPCRQACLRDERQDLRDSSARLAPPLRPCRSHPKLPGLGLLVFWRQTSARLARPPCQRNLPPRASRVTSRWTWCAGRACLKAATSHGSPCLPPARTTGPSPPDTRPSAAGGGRSGGNPPCPDRTGPASARPGRARNGRELTCPCRWRANRPRSCGSLPGSWAAGRAADLPPPPAD